MQAWIIMMIEDYGYLGIFFRKNGFIVMVKFSAGMAKMSFLSFLLYLLLGTMIWNAVLTYVGVYAG